MIVKKITSVDEPLKAQLIELCDILDDPEMDIQATVGMMISRLDGLGLFGAFDGDKLSGFALAEPPGVIYPKRAFLWITAVDKNVPRRVSNGLFDMMCRWCISKGATYLWGWTKRDIQVIKRLYGFEEVAEKQVIRPLIGDDWLKIERVSA